MNLVFVIGMMLLQTVRLDPSDEVRSVIDRFAEAYVAADVAALDSMLGDPYLHIDGATGKVVPREAWLEWNRERRQQIEAGTLVIDSYEISDLAIRMRRDSANVTGIVRSSGTREGDPFETALRFTNVWVLEGGQWQRALFHDSALPPESAD
jgi:ketosteroid isomerase-like protein